MTWPHSEARTGSCGPAHTGGRGIEECLGLPVGEASAARLPGGEEGPGRREACWAQLCPPSPFSSREGLCSLPCFSLPWCPLPTGKCLSSRARLTRPLAPCLPPSPAVLTPHFSAPYTLSPPPVSPAPAAGASPRSAPPLSFPGCLLLFFRDSAHHFQAAFQHTQAGLSTLPRVPSIPFAPLPARAPLRFRGCSGCSLCSRPPGPPLTQVFPPHPSDYGFERSPFSECLANFWFHPLSPPDDCVLGQTYTSSLG